MTEQEIQKLLKEQTVKLPNAGRERWPGYFMFLDEEQIMIDGQIKEMKLYAWYELDKNGNQPLAASAFLFQSPLGYTYLDYFFEAISIWKHYMEKYPCV